MSSQRLTHILNHANATIRGANRGELTYDALIDALDEGIRAEISNHTRMKLSKCVQSHEPIEHDIYVFLGRALGRLLLLLLLLLSSPRRVHHAESLLLID